MVESSFFDESTEQSLVKAAIVTKYFWAWAKVITPSVKKRGGKIAYIDLFAGPGRYKDGTKSTPLMILENAVQDADMRQMLVAIFNDADANNVESLGRAIKSLPGIGKLKYQPQIYTHSRGRNCQNLYTGALRSHPVLCRPLGLQRSVSASN